MRWLLFSGVSLMLITSYTNCNRFSSVEGSQIQLIQSVPQLGESSLPSNEIDQESSSTNASLEYNAVSGQFESVTASTPMKSCQILGEFPVKTHYQSGIGYKANGQDAAVLDINRPPSQIDVELATSALVPYYGLNYFPTPINYFADSFDSEKPSQLQIEAALKYLCSKGTPLVRYTHASSAINSEAQLLNLIRSNENSFQVINGVTFKSNYFALIIPPNWSRQVSRGALIAGHYSVNQYLAENAQGMFEVLASVHSQDRKGAIGLFWNGGGVYASRSVNPRSYSELNDFLKIAVPALAIDRDRVVTGGGSRGGVTALNIASSPEVDQVRVGFAIANVPPAEIDLFSDLATPTFPALMPVVDTSTGYFASWQDSFKMPSGRSGKEQMNFVLTGTSDPLVMKNSINLTSASKMNKLVANNTSVFLDLGTHDFIVPFVLQKRLFEKYKAANVKVEAQVNYRAGHGGFADFYPKLASALLKLNMSANPRNEVLVSPQVQKNTLVSVDGSQVLNKNWNYKPQPLEIEFPKYIINESQFQIVATGTPGKKYFLQGANQGGDARSFVFVLEADGTFIGRLNPLEFPDNEVISLIGIYELDVNDRAVKALKLENTVDGSAKIEIVRFAGNTKSIARELLPIIYKNTFGRGYIAGTNYGLVETAEGPVSAAQALAVDSYFGRTTPPPAVPMPPAPVQPSCQLDFKPGTSFKVNQDFNISIASKEMLSVQVSCGDPNQPNFANFNNKNGDNLFPANTFPAYGNVRCDFRGMTLSGQIISCSPSFQVINFMAP